MWTHSHAVEATGEPAPSVVTVLRRFTIVGFLLVAVAACGTGKVADTTSSTASPAVVPASGGTIAWKACPDSSADHLQCARFSVPYDYKNPSVGHFSLKLVKRPANDPKRRIGSMLVNPGGPGFGGTYLPENAMSYFSSDLMDRFDILGWDPRGTG